MPIQFEQLVAYFDGDISGITSAAAKATSIVDALENRLKNFKSDIKLSVSGLGNEDSLNGLRDILNLQAQIARAEKTVEQAKRATIATEREQIKLEADRLKLLKQTDQSGNKQPVAKAPPVSTNSDKEFARSKAAIDKYQRAASDDIRRYQQQTASGEKALTDLIKQQSDQQFRARTKAIQKSAVEYQKELKKISSAEKSNAGGNNFGGDFSSSLFGAVTAGNLAATAISKGIGLVGDLISEAKNLGVTAVGLSANFEQTQNSFLLFNGSN